VLKLDWREDKDVPTASTDGKIVLYNPEWFGQNSIEEGLTIVCHEGLHPAFGHHLPENRDDRDLQLWNMAGDYVINQILVDGGFTMPKCGGLQDNRFHNMTIYQVFDILQAEQKKGQGPFRDGRGVNGKEWNFGAVEDMKGADGGEPTSSEQKESEEDWKVVLQQSLNSAKRRGNVPAGLERLIKEYIDPKVNWKDVLYNIFQEVCKDDYSWGMPNRDYIVNDLYVPSLYSRRPGEIVVVIDTSGSIDMELLTKFGSELTEILTQFKGLKTHVIYVDTKVNGYEEYTQEDLPLQLKTEGGGGTDFTPAFDWVVENDIDPRMLIYFTDLDGSMPDYEPDYPVVWAKYGGYNQNVPFGDILVVE